MKTAPHSPLAPAAWRPRPGRGAALPLFLLVACAGLAPSSGLAQNLNVHDGSDQPPRLFLVQNLWGLDKYPSKDAEWPVDKKLTEIKAAGFDAFDIWVGGMKDEEVQAWQVRAAQVRLGIGVEAGPEAPADLIPTIAIAKRLKSPYLDAHVGNYYLPEPAATELLRGLSERAKREGIALVIQTHRGRVTQDLLRTIAYAQAIPDLRFDLDFSHYFVGGEITGALSPPAEAALEQLMKRAVMLDGRVSNGEQVQVDMGAEGDNASTKVFAALWKRVMVGWLKNAKPGDLFPFRIELGPPGYAILDREGREISDRWEQQKLMRALVIRLWNEAVQETGRGVPR